MIPLIGRYGAIFLLFLTTRAVALAPKRANSKSKSHVNALKATPSDRSNAYFDHWSRLLIAEQQEAVAELRLKRSSWSRQRLEQSGMSVLEASAEPESDLFGEKIIRIYKEKETRFRDLFSRGDVLVMTTLGRAMAARSSQQALPRECCIVDVGKDWMTLAVGPSWPPGLWEARRLPGSFHVRLDRTAPRAPLKAQQTALELARKGEAGEAASILVDSFCSSNTTVTTDVLDEMSCPPSRLKDYSQVEMEKAVANALSDAKNATRSFDPNSSQQGAIKWALARKISLLIGPPGTGKTRVAALLISTALRIQHHESHSSPQQRVRVLAVAHSNGAADVLLEALLDIGIPAVRVGRPASVSPSVRHRTVVAIADLHPEVVSLRQQSRDLTLNSHVRSHLMTETKHCINDVCQSILKTAPVVVASCVGAHQLLEATNTNDDDRIPSFPLVVVDEAAQTTEPGLLCALAAAKAEQVVFVGDTLQLPPTVASETTEIRDSLGISPMARLETMGVDQKTLRLQYRMAPALLEHPSQYFYSGLVSCARVVPDDSPPRGFAWPNSTAPLAFIQTGSNREVTHEFGGKSNPTEATLVVDIIQGLLEACDVEAKGIAVISPYAKQVQLLRNEMAIRNVRNIRVGTVDSFQGQETDIVLISAVRSNSENELGFLRDPRRLCVAITRARRGLVIVGDERVLNTSRHWRALIDSCRDRGCFTNAQDMGDAVLDTGNDNAKPLLEEPIKPFILRDDCADMDQLLDSLLDSSDELLGLFDSD